MFFKKLAVDLRPHNKKSYKASKKMFETENRICFTQATGTGKSYVIMQFLDDYKEVNKLLVAPSHEILNQFKNNNQIDIQRTIFMTYQKLLSLYNRDEMNELGSLEFICLDEMHRAGAKRWELAVKELLNLNPNSKLLGATATPIRSMDSKDMTKELFNGNCSYELTLVDAMIQRILPVPKYISALYDIQEDIDDKENKLNSIENPDEKVHQLLDDLKNLKIELCSTLSIDTILREHLLETIEENGGAKILVFCNDIKRLKASEIKINKWFSDAFDLPIETYTYHYKDKNGYKNFEKFKNSKKEGSIKLLLSIEKLNEGIHIDDIDSIIMLRKTTSNIIYHQQLGRVLSISGSKKPIVFDLVNNYNNLDNSINLVKDLKEGLEKNIRSGKNKNKKEQNIVIDFHDYTHDAIKTFKEIDEKLNCYWAEEEIEDLKKYYSIESSEQLEKRFNKKLTAIAYKAKTLGLKKDIYWTEKQMEDLKKYYSIESSEQLQKRFNKKIDTIRSKAKSLGLTKSICWTEKQIKDLKKYYPIKDFKYLEKILNKTRTSIRSKAKSLGLEKILITKIFWTKKQIKELKKYYPIETNEQLEKRFNKKITAIKTKANSLGFKKKSRWTEKQIKNLIKYYPIETKNQLEKRFNKPYAHIQAKASNLGIKRISIIQSRAKSLKLNEDHSKE